MISRRRTTQIGVTLAIAAMLAAGCSSTDEGIDVDAAPSDSATSDPNDPGTSDPNDPGTSDPNDLGTSEPLTGDPASPSASTSASPSAADAEDPAPDPAPPPPSVAPTAGVDYTPRIKCRGPYLRQTNVTLDPLPGGVTTTLCPGPKDLLVTVLGVEKPNDPKTRLVIVQNNGGRLIINWNVQNDQKRGFNNSSAGDGLSQFIVIRRGKMDRATGKRGDLLPVVVHRNFSGGAVLIACGAGADNAKYNTGFEMTQTTRRVISMTGLKGRLNPNNSPGKPPTVQNLFPSSPC